MPLQDYFRVISASNRVLHFELKGFWNQDVVQNRGEEFVSAFKSAVDQMNGRFVALADASDFKPYTAEAKRLVGETMQYARQKGLHKAVEVLPDAVSQLSVKEAASSTGKDDFRIVVNNVLDAKNKAQTLAKEL